MNPESRYQIILLVLCFLLTGPGMAGAEEDLSSPLADDKRAGQQLSTADTEWQRIPFLITVPAEKGKKREALAFRDLPDVITLKGIIESDGALAALVNGRMVRKGDIVKKHKILDIQRYKIVVQGPGGKRDISILGGDDSARVSSNRVTDK